MICRGHTQNTNVDLAELTQLRKSTYQERFAKSIMDQGAERRWPVYLYDVWRLSSVVEVQNRKKASWKYKTGSQRGCIRFLKDSGSLFII